MFEVAFAVPLGLHHAVIIVGHTLGAGGCAVGVLGRTVDVRAICRVVVPLVKHGVVVENTRVYGKFRCVVERHRQIFGLAGYTDGRLVGRGYWNIRVHVGDVDRLNHKDGATPTRQSNF